MDVARAAMGQGWPTAAGLWSGDGVSEPSRSEGRMKGRRFWLLLPAKVTRLGRRNRIYLQNAISSLNPETTDKLTQTSQPGIRLPS